MLNALYSMTRLVRAQFESDDIREARVTCSGSAPVDTERQAEGTRETEEVFSLNPAPPARSILSFRIPEWVSSSYATIRHHSHDIAHRSPIPFTEAQPSLSRLMSMPSTAVGSPEEAPPTAPSSSRDEFGPVAPHPPPMSWDDQSTLDLPYDNPYYTRAIKNVLWLPRDPCGTLDLDDTVDLKISISVDPSAGQIGTWIGVPGEGRPASDVFEASFDSSTLLPRPPQEDGASSMLSASARGDEMFTSVFTSEPEVDGTEDIDLPEILAKRAEQRDDIEHVARPRRLSTFNHQSDKSTLGSRRRPSSSRQMSRSVSDVRPRSKPQKQNSIMSVFDNHSVMNRSVSQPADPSIRPDAHAQAELVMAHPTASHISEAHPPLTRSANISANRAIYHEVLAEEKEALKQRLEAEQAEVDKTQAKSWLTKWMFTKAE